VNGKSQPRPNDTVWTHLLDVERKLEAGIAAAQADARARVAQTRAAAESAVPDAQALAALAAAEEQADIDRHRSELARIAEDADSGVRALTEAPGSLIDALAQFALGAVLADAPPAERR
jgi:hypothetical protein